MAIGLSGPALPDATVNDCLDEIAAKLTAASVVNAVYTGRVAETKVATAAAVTSISSLMSDTPLGMTVGYDYIVDALVRIDGDYEAAERSLNAICDGAWRALWGAHLPYWSDCFPFAADQKPASPQELAGWRRAILYVRVIPI